MPQATIDNWRRGFPNATLLPADELERLPESIDLALDELSGFQEMLSDMELADLIPPAWLRP